MYLLDTDILVNLMGRCPSTALIAKLASVPPEQQCISSITLEELIVGASRFGRRSAALLGQIDTRLMPNLQVLPFDASAARRYGELHASLARKGSPVSETALRVAADCAGPGPHAGFRKSREFQTCARPVRGKLVVVSPCPDSSALFTLTSVLSHQGRGDFVPSPLVERACPITPSPLVGEGWGEGGLFVELLLTLTLILSRQGRG